MEFLEDMNIPGETCPPAGAVPGRLEVYRIADNIPVKAEDIRSYHALYPAKVFRDACKARACSVFTDREELSGLLKMPKFKGKKAVRISIREKDGVLLSTPGRAIKSHYSWWVSREFDPASAKEAV
jgi:hypothetical protein